MRLVDLTGKKFGRLLVLKRHCENTRGNKPKWVCQCDCGTVVIVDGSSLSTGNTRSCGCLKREIDSYVNATHGQSKTKLYSVWSNLKERCDKPENKSYSRYGGRGITYSSEWKHFEPFYNWAIATGYKEGLTIDRINPNDNYCPENCRLISLASQSRNKSNTIYVTIAEDTKPLAEWCEIHNVKYPTALWRYHHGYTPEQICNIKETM